MYRDYIGFKDRINCTCLDDFSSIHVSMVAFIANYYIRNLGTFIDAKDQDLDRKIFLRSEQFQNMSMTQLAESFKKVDIDETDVFHKYNKMIVRILEDLKECKLGRNHNCMYSSLARYIIAADRYTRKQFSSDFDKLNDQKIDTPNDVEVAPKLSLKEVHTETFNYILYKIIKQGSLATALKFHKNATNIYGTSLSNQQTWLMFMKGAAIEKLSFNVLYYYNKIIEREVVDQKTMIATIHYFFLLADFDVSYKNLKEIMGSMDKIEHTQSQKKDSVKIYHEFLRKCLSRNQLQTFQDFAKDLNSSFIHTKRLFVEYHLARCDIDSAMSILDDLLKELYSGKVFAGNAVSSEDYLYISEIFKLIFTYCIHNYSELSAIPPLLISKMKYCGFDVGKDNYNGLSWKYLMLGEMEPILKLVREDGFVFPTELMNHFMRALVEREMYDEAFEIYFRLRQYAINLPPTQDIRPILSFHPDEREEPSEFEILAQKSNGSVKIGPNMFTYNELLRLGGELYRSNNISAEYYHIHVDWVLAEMKTFSIPKDCKIVASLIRYYSSNAYSGDDAFEKCFRLFADHADFLERKFKYLLVPHRLMDTTEFKVWCRDRARYYHLRSRGGNIGLPSWFVVDRIVKICVDYGRREEEQQILEYAENRRDVNIPVYKHLFPHYRKKL